MKGGALASHLHHPPPTLNTTAFLLIASKGDSESTSISPAEFIRFTVRTRARPVAAISGSELVTAAFMPSSVRLLERHSNLPPLAEARELRRDDHCD